MLAPCPGFLPSLNPRPSTLKQLCIEFKLLKGLYKALYRVPGVGTTTGDGHGEFGVYLR